MKTTVLLGCVFFILLSCGKSENPGNRKRFQNTTFIHLFYPTENECMAAQTDPDFFINCHQQLDFINDHEAHIMLTDIVWNGTYKIEGNEIVLTFENAYEIPEGEIRFVILSPSRLLNKNEGSVWNKMHGNSIWH